MKEGEKRRNCQKEEAARWNPGGRLAAELKFITTERFFSDDKLPTSHIMSIFAPEFVFLHS